MPWSLSEQERGTAVRSGSPVLLPVWVNHGDEAVQVLASQIEYTDTAVHIMWMGVAADPWVCWI